MANITPNGLGPLTSINNLKKFPIDFLRDNLMEASSQLRFLIPDNARLKEEEEEKSSQQHMWILDDLV